VLHRLRDLKRFKESVIMLNWLKGRASWESAEAYFKVKLKRDMDSVAG